MTVLEDAYRNGVVVGLKEVSGVVARQDIDKMLLEQPEAFNLMLMAFMELMEVEVPWKDGIDPKFKVTSKDRFSWFQMAGIHGVPFAPWDNLIGKNQETKSHEGYCAHSTPTFECWHRPYLSMLEQTLFRQVENIAERFGRSETLDEQTKRKYFEAAKTFRLPYFDYYRPRDYARMIPGVTEDIIPEDKKHGKPERNRQTAVMTRVAYDFRLPQIFTMPKVMIRTLPDNELKLMKNPLFQYKLPENALTDAEWEQSQIDITVPVVKNRTLRYGSANPRSVTWLNDNLNKVREDLLRLVLTFMEQGPYGDFQNFSTNEIFKTAAEPETATKRNLVGPPFGSLEAVHNDYHVYLGGFVGKRKLFGPGDLHPDLQLVGHMTCVPVAAFDPVFWFHHVQIDRLFAIWQAINPNSWFHNLTDPKDQATNTAPLYPFRRSKGTTPEDDEFWTPELSRKVSDFGYTYPDLEESQDSEAIRQGFYKRHMWSRRLVEGDVLGVGRMQPPADMLPLDVSKAQVFSYEIGSTEEYVFETLAPAPSTGGIELLQRSKQALSLADAKATHSYEWYIDDSVERLAEKGSFTIFYFIDLNGAISKPIGAEWTRVPGFVGLTHIFTAPPESCGNCALQAEQKKIVTSTTAITSLLLDYVETRKLKSMKEEDVKPFLIANLKWRAQKVQYSANGDIIDPRKLSLENQFKISINCKKAPLPGLGFESEGKPEFIPYDDIIKTIIEEKASQQMDSTTILT